MGQPGFAVFQQGGAEMPDSAAHFDIFGLDCMRFFEGDGRGRREITASLGLDDFFDAFDGPEKVDSSRPGRGEQFADAFQRLFERCLVVGGAGKAEGDAIGSSNANCRGAAHFHGDDRVSDLMLVVASDRFGFDRQQSLIEQFETARIAVVRYSIYHSFSAIQNRVVSKKRNFSFQRE